jgi:hypothetical protein
VGNKERSEGTRFHPAIFSHEIPFKQKISHPSQTRVRLFRMRFFYLKRRLNHAAGNVFRGMKLCVGSQLKNLSLPKKRSKSLRGICRGMELNRRRRPFQVGSAGFSLFLRTQRDSHNCSVSYEFAGQTETTTYSFQRADSVGIRMEK